MASDTLNYSLITLDFERNLIIQSIYVAPSIAISYVLFTKVIGPVIMQNRKPMDLQFTMILYNFILVALNAYLSVRCILLAVEMWPHHCNLENSPIYLDSSKFYDIAWLGLFSKFFELFDTVIFILRKKFQQVSFLHVFHHFVVFILTWIAFKFRLVGYYLILIGSINCSVHVVLYLYYALSALGDSFKKYLWWKEYLTRIQIIQFLVIMAYMTYAFNTGCEELNVYGKIGFAALVIITALFLNFYFRTYTTTKKSC